VGREKNVMVSAKRTQVWMRSTQLQYGRFEADLTEIDVYKKLKELLLLRPTAIASPAPKPDFGSVKPIKTVLLCPCYVGIFNSKVFQ